MLQVKYKNSDKRPLWLVDAQYTIGSGANCDIPIDDASVAAHQATLKVTPEGVSIVNMGIAESLAVNGELLAKHRPLVHGDEVIVGSVALELVDPKLLRESAEARAPQAAEKKGNSSVWSLKAMNTALATKHFPIDRDVVLGRSNECDITLGVAHLSRRHARLRLVDKQLEVEDLRSSNGTFVNGTKVEKSLLRDGDELRFDTLSFSVSGPEGDSDSTMLRPQEDIDKTTIRPAIKDPQPAQVNKPRLATAKPLSSKYQSQQNSSAEVVDDFSKGEGSGRGILVLALVVIVVGIALWWFLA